jgi:K+-transporting ATPase ATPase A chain
MKYAMLAVLILPVAILGFTSVSAMLPAAVASIGTARSARPVGNPLCLHVGGRQQRLRLWRPDSANTPWYNTTLGIAMLLGRFAYVVPVLAIAGSIAAKVKTPAVRRHVPHPYAALRRPADRHHPHSRRPAVLPGAGSRPHRRALR